MAKNDPFSPNEAEAESGEPVQIGEILQDQNLGDAAQGAFGDELEGIGGAQEQIPGTDFTKVRFVGMSMDSIEDRKMSLGDSFEFLVKGTVIGEGVDVSKTDGHKKPYVKIDVNSVVIKE